MDICTDPIDQIVENGIRCKNGEVHQFDVIILATGFALTSDTKGLNLYGQEGLSQQDLWNSRGGVSLDVTSVELG